MPEKVPSFKVTPDNTSLETLSPLEAAGLAEEGAGPLHGLVVRCILAVLSSMDESDDVKGLLESHGDFDAKVVRTPGGIELELLNAPQTAFVSYQGEDEPEPRLKLIEGLRRHIFGVLRDLALYRAEVEKTGRFRLDSSRGITDAVFLILRNAGVFNKTGRHKIVVCWGGHSIKREEYEYSREVGNQCGLRMMDVITGCGQGAMRGPMEGAAIGHAKQRLEDGRYVGITEPGIIASEPPNPIVKPLVIMPDIEKRLEAFVRLGHGIIVFPGGVGTMEEMAYILTLLNHPQNREAPFPLILTGPDSSRDYWDRVTGFFRRVLGDDAAGRAVLVPGGPEAVAVRINQGLLQVKEHRENTKDAYYFNAGLHIPYELQEPFPATHESVARLEIRAGGPPHELAATLRRVFSAVVTGNVRPEGIRAVEEQGPFRFRGDQAVVEPLLDLLDYLAREGRMKKTGLYRPCYACGE